MTSLRTLILFMILAGQTFGQTTGSLIKGKVSDPESNEALIGASVILRTPDGRDLPYGAVTDLDGQFAIQLVPSGVYVLRATYVGYQAFESAAFNVLPDSTYIFEIRLDTYHGLSAEDAREHIRRGIVQIYLWAGFPTYGKERIALAQKYGFEIATTGCLGFRTERYDSVMIQYLEERNGKGWFQKFQKEWDRIK